MTKEWKITKEQIAAYQSLIDQGNALVEQIGRLRRARKNWWDSIHKEYNIPEMALNLEASTGIVRPLWKHEGSE